MDLPFDKLPKFLTVAGITLASAGASLVYSGYLAQEVEMLRLIDITEPYKLHHRARTDIRPLRTGNEPSDCSDLQGNHRAFLDCADKYIAWARGVTQDADIVATAIKGDMAEMGATLEGTEAFWDKFKEQDRIYKMQMLLGTVGILVGCGVAGYGIKGWRELERSA